MSEDKTRYSEDELKEFETLIYGKLDKAREEFRILKDTLNRNNDAGTVNARLQATCNRP